MKTTIPDSDKPYPPVGASRPAPSKSISLTKPGVVICPPKPKPTLPYGSKVGRLRIGPFSHTGRCMITCDCGYRGYKPTKAIVHLLKEGLGCGSAGCVVDSFERALWADIKNSLKIQLFLLIELFPEEVPSRWGGKLDDFEDLSLDEGYANFVADELGGKPLTKIKWIERETTLLPFVPGNIVFSGMPSNLLKKSADMLVDTGAGEMHISEIMRFTGKTESQVLMKAFELRTFDGVLSELL